MHSAPTSLAPLLGGIPTQNAGSTESFAAVSDGTDADGFSAVMDDVQSQSNNLEQAEDRCASCEPDAGRTDDVSRQRQTDESPNAANQSVGPSDATGEGEAPIGETTDGEDVSELASELAIDPANVIPAVSVEVVATQVESPLPNLEQQVLSEVAAVDEVRSPIAVESAVNTEPIGGPQVNEEAVGFIHRASAEANDAAQAVGFDNPISTVRSNGSIDGIESADLGSQDFESPITSPANFEELPGESAHHAGEDTNPIRPELTQATNDTSPFNTPDDSPDTSAPTVHREGPVRNTKRNSQDRESAGRSNPFASGQPSNRAPIAQVNQVQQATHAVATESSEAPTQLPTEIDATIATPAQQSVTSKSRRPTNANEVGETGADVEREAVEVASDPGFDTEQEVLQQQFAESETEGRQEASNESQNAIEEHRAIKTSGAIASLFAGAGIAAAGVESESDEISSTPQGTITDVSNAYDVAGPLNAATEAAQDVNNDIETFETVAFETLAEDTYETILDRIEVLEDGETEEIELQIDPPELGRLNIRVSRMADEVSARITVIDPGTLEMLQGELNQIRDMLDEAGISLSSFELEQQTAQQQQSGSDHREPNQHSSSRPRSSAPTNTRQTQSPIARRDNQAIDILA